MNETDEMPTDVEVIPTRNSAGWQGRLIAVVVVGVATVALILLLAKIAHVPKMVYPAEMQTQTAELRSQNSELRPMNKEVLDSLMKAYGLDEPCIEGKKYGALCQDGEVIHSGSEGVCEDHGGVKGWIECR
jgi:hypothetical protein